MDQQAYESAKASYQQGNWAQAASILTSVKRPGETFGAADHLLGNSLMKLGMFDDAAKAYAEALADPTYGKKGALSCNRARALFAAGDFEQAITSAEIALEDPSYTTPYKAYMCLGNAQFKLNNYQDAGVAFRNAAMDETNTDAAQSLLKLGLCFMYMGRPADAVEAYRTALDFSSPLASQSEIYAQLGRAYVAANKMPEAVDAFNRALADGTYTLEADAQASFEAAQRAVEASRERPSETDQFLAQAGYGASRTSVDPLDPMGQSGEMIPSPDDTGFFSFTEEEMASVAPQKVVKKRKGRLGKVLIFFFILLILAGGAAGFAYYKGFGWPTQTATVESLFQAKTNNSDMGTVFAAQVSPEARSQMESLIPAGASVTIKGIDQNMTNSKVLCEALLSQGGKQLYTIDMVRDKISWKITKITPEYLSQAEGGGDVQAGIGATGQQAASNAGQSSTGQADSTQSNSSQNSTSQSQDGSTTQQNSDQSNS